MSHLCCRCTTIIEEAFDGEMKEPVGHHQSFMGLKEAVDERCYICLQLWTKIQGTEPTSLISPPGDSTPEVNTTYSINQRAIPEAFDIFIDLESETMPFTRLHLTPWTVISSGIVESYLAPFAQTDHISRRATVDQAQKWLQNCLSSHKACYRLKGGELPTRLVEIENVEDQLRARVRNSLGLPPHTDYLTLSHCWGQAPFLTLRKDNLERLGKSIPLDDLPQVFQDALLITHKLGFYYLWIDSLCIIQGSEGEADWLLESPTMDRVYGNSICNLAATGFPDGQEGLFPKHQTDEILPPKFKHRSLGKDTSYYITPANSWMTEVTASPLHRRGWVYQEQIMAPRILHFTKKQVYWECYAVKACEVFPSRFPPYGLYIDNLKNLVRVPSAQSQRLQVEDLYREWLYLTREYSRASLTYAKDKLPAMSGLAKLFSSRLQDQYLAGLWRRDLIRGMLWSGMPETTAATTYRAPTWSWASVDGFILYPGWGGSEFAWESLAQVSSAETKPLIEGDVTGQLIGGSILISGPLREVTIETALETTRTSFLCEVVFTPGNRDPTATEAILRYSVQAQHPRLSIDPCVNGMLPTGTLFLMPLTRLLVADVDSCWMHGLVLRSKGTRGQYEKVGTFSTNQKEILQSLFLENNFLQSHNYEQYDGDSGYTIRIF